MPELAGQPSGDPHVLSTMQWQSPYSAPAGDYRNDQRSISAPKEHEGIGNALRSAYLPRISDMPRDMAELLDRLS